MPDLLEDAILDLRETSRSSARPQATSRLDALRHAAATAPRVLLVEDDETLALVMSYNLRSAGYSVDWIARGDLVDAYMSLHDVDALILDWMLPGRSGLDICRWIRRRAGDLPILMATALTHEDDRAAALKAGADDYIAKPFTMAALVQRVDLMLRKRTFP